VAGSFELLKDAVQHKSLITGLVHMSLKHHENLFEVLTWRNIVDSTCHMASNMKTSWPDNCIIRFTIQKTVG